MYDLDANEQAIKRGFTLSYLIEAVWGITSRAEHPTAEDIFAICEGHEVPRKQQTELYGHFGYTYCRLDGEWYKGGDEMTDEFPEPGEMRETG